MKKSKDFDFQESREPQTVYGPPPAMGDDEMDEEYDPKEDEVFGIYGPPPSRMKMKMLKLLSKIRRKSHEKK